MPRVVVIGLGPGPAELISVAAVRAIEAIPKRFVRTERHPSTSLVAPATSFDSVYEEAAAVELVYSTIVERLVQAATEADVVLYAVPGSPLVAERTVELLRGDDRVELEVIPALSFLDLAWDRLGVDPIEAGARLVDGHRFREDAAGQSGPLLVSQCDSPLVLSEIKLSVDDGPAVTVLQRLGLPDERQMVVPWAELDRAVTPDHLTSVWIPGLAEPVAGELARFAELVRTLRERCPWDQKQTHQSLTRHLIEETYEVLEAIDELDAGYEHLEEELGDLLFQVVFHATLAAEAGQFTLADVARGIHDKLVRRHPHVFGGEVEDWEQIKKAEKGHTSLMEGVSGSLPALLYAHKVQAKAATVGFDWDDVVGPLAKVREELAELEADPGHDELGDVLFSVVNVARHLGVDPESALRDAAAKFRARFAGVESLAAARGLDLAQSGQAELDRLWDEVKAGADTPPVPPDR